MAANPILARLDITSWGDIGLASENILEIVFESKKLGHPGTKIVVAKDDKEIDVALRSKVIAEVGAEDSQFLNFGASAEFGDPVHGQDDPMSFNESESPHKGNSNRP